MLIFMCTRQTRTTARVTITHYDYRTRPSRSWVIYEGTVPLQHGQPASVAAAHLASAVCGALEQAEELSVGRTAYVQLVLPWPEGPDSPPGQTPAA